MVKKLIATALDVVRNPAKYRKGFVVPASILVYAVSQYAGADSSLTLKVVAVLAAAGVYGVKNVVV